MAELAAWGCRNAIDELRFTAEIAAVVKAVVAWDVKVKRLC